MARSAVAVCLLALLAVAAAESVKTSAINSKKYPTKHGYEEKKEEEHKKVWVLRLTETTDSAIEAKDEVVGGNTWLLTTLLDKESDVVGHAVWTGVVYAEGKANWLGNLSLTDGDLVLQGDGASQAGEGAVETYVVLGGSGQYLGASGTAVYDGTVTPAKWAITLSF